MTSDRCTSAPTSAWANWRRIVSLTPSLEVGLGDNLTIAALNGDLTWSFSDMTNAPWGLYAGGSLGLIWIDPDGGTSDSNLGLSALIGLTRNFENGHDAPAGGPRRRAGQPGPEGDVRLQPVLTMDAPRPAPSLTPPRWPIGWRGGVVTCGDRLLFRAAAGPRWLRLHLAGDEHFCLLAHDDPRRDATDAAERTPAGASGGRPARRARSSAADAAVRRTVDADWAPCRASGWPACASPAPTGRRCTWCTRCSARPATQCCWTAARVACGRRVGRRTGCCPRYRTARSTARHRGP